MSNIIRLNQASEKLPRCRLCGDFMEKAYDEKRKVFIYACRRDAWAIRADDPFLATDAMARAEASLRASEDGKELFDCPHCRATMRFVCTSTGYMKFKCVKTAKRGCGLMAEMKEPDRATATEVGASVKDIVLDLTAEEKRKFS
jgi:transcription elongation factor Elf1